MLLGRAFASTEPALTEMILRIHRACPKLLNSLLPRSEHYLGNPDADEMYLSILGTPEQESPRAFSCISRTYAERKLRLPLWPHKLPQDDLFLEQLREAYGQDYGMDSFVEWGRMPLQWCQKFSFTDRFEVTLSIAVEILMSSI